MLRWLTASTLLLWVWVGACAGPAPKDPGPFDHDAHAGYVMGSGTIGCRDCHVQVSDMRVGGLKRPGHCNDCHVQGSVAVKAGLNGTRNAFQFDHEFHCVYKFQGKTMSCWQCHPKGEKVALPNPGSCWECHEQGGAHPLKSH